MRLRYKLCHERWRQQQVFIPQGVTVSSCFVALVDCFAPSRTSQSTGVLSDLYVTLRVGRR